MDSRTVLRQLLRAPPTYRTFLQTATRPQFAYASAPSQSRYISAPRVLQPSFWASLLPKPLRPSSSSSSEPIPTIVVDPETGRREWNPATPYIILALLVGSQAIQILWLKRDRERFLRKSEAKIGVLREVIERVQRGEEVEVEGALGTGDSEREAEWEKVLREIEGEELLWRSKKRRRAERERVEAAEKERQEAAAKKVEDFGEVAGQGNKGEDKVEVYKGARFY